MHLSLFSRLTIGYLVIFLMVAVASASAVLQLRYFRDLTESILNIDNRMLDHEKILTDLLLSQSRAEQKFIITRDESLVSAICPARRSEFEARLQSAPGFGRSGRSLDREGAFSANSEPLQQLVEDEARWVRTKKNYPQAQFKQDKDNLVDAHLLDELRALARQSTTMTTRKLRSWPPLRPTSPVKPRSSLPRAVYWPSS